MKKTDSNIPNIQKKHNNNGSKMFSNLQGDKILWDTVYLQGKYYMDDPQTIGKLVAVQKQLQQQQQRALQYTQELNQRAASLNGQVQNEVVDKSFVTVIDRNRQLKNKMKIDKQLQYQEDVYARKIAQAREKKKQQRKRVGTNIVTTKQGKNDYKSTKGYKPQQENDTEEANLHRSMQRNKNGTKMLGQKQEFQANEQKAIELKEVINQNNVQIEQQTDKPTAQIKQISEKVPLAERIGDKFFYEIRLKLQKMGEQFQHEQGQGQHQYMHNIQHEHSHHVSQKEYVQKYKESEVMKTTKQLLHQMNSQLNKYGLVAVSESQRSQKQAKQQLVQHKNTKIQEKIVEQKQLEISVKIQKKQQNVQKQKEQIACVVQKKQEQKSMQKQKFIQEPQQKQQTSPKISNVQDKQSFMNLLNHKDFSQIKENQSLSIRKTPNLSVMPSILNYQITIQHAPQALQAQPQTSQTSQNDSQKNKLTQEITMLRQAISQLRVQKLKYHVVQSQLQQKLTEQSLSMISPYTRRPSPPPHTEKGHLTQRNGSVLHNIAESAVTQFPGSNIKRSNAQMGFSGKIVKNLSPSRRGKVTYHSRVNTLQKSKQECIKEVVHQNQQNSIQFVTINPSKFNQQLTNQKSIAVDSKQKQEQKENPSSLMAKLSDEFKPRTSKEEFKKQSSSLIKQQSNSQLKASNLQKSKGFEIRIQVQSRQKSIQRQNKSKIQKIPQTSSQKVQTDMQSQMPKALSKSRYSNPPKFKIHSQSSNKKNDENLIKKKLLDQFELMEKASAMQPAQNHQNPPLKPRQRASRISLKASQVKSVNRIESVSRRKVWTVQKAKPATVSNVGSQRPQNKSSIDRINNQSKADRPQNKSKVDSTLTKSKYETMPVNSKVQNAQQNNKINFRVKKQTQTVKNIRNDSKSVRSHSVVSNKRVPSQQNCVVVPLLNKLYNNQSISIDNQSQKQIFSLDIDITQEIKHITGFKVPKRNIQFSTTQIPKFPQPPLSNVSIQNMIQLIRKIGKALSIRIDDSQIGSLVMKKYKNCIMIDLAQGTLVWHYTGKIYLGEWDQQYMLKHGSGMEYVPEKYYYNGQFLKGKRNGSGIMVQTNGCVYEGQWAQGQKQGRGKYRDPSIRMIYQGEWKDGKRDGYGYYEIQEQCRYQGTFQNNYRHGFGTQDFAAGDSYKGQYVKGRLQGKGIYVWSSGAIYEGSFFQGCKHGKGKWKSQQGQVFIGGYNNDKKHGYGKYKWQNGCLFEGHFQNDKKNGEGVLIHPGGRQVKGVWRDGKMVENRTQKHLEKEDPLEPKKSKVVQQETIFRIVEAKQTKDENEQRKLQAIGLQEGPIVNLDHKS